VPIDSPECNFNMAYEALISNIDIPEENVHRVRVEMHAEAAASQYEREVLHFTGGIFDVIMLGLGEDGHTASCFPGTLQYLKPDRLVEALFVPQVNMWRITFTPRLINAARHVLFLVSGEDKADVLERVIHGPYQPDVLPSQLIAPTDGDLIWMIDRAAADSHF
jgi:6-phosphogluconolactonase